MGGKRLFGNGRNDFQDDGFGAFGFGVVPGEDFQFTTALDRGNDKLPVASVVGDRFNERLQVLEGEMVFRLLDQDQVGLSR